MTTLFISHAHQDAELAAAIKTLIEGCFPGHIRATASSSEPAKGGVPMGRPWLEWIHEQVQTSRFTVVVLTPNSLEKPWLMWEAGAVSGVALAGDQSSVLVPILYRISMEQVPSPLQARLSAFGEDAESMRRVLQSLNEPELMPQGSLETLAKEFVPSYLDTVARVLADTPPPLTESAVQDWLDRMSYFERTNRRSEIAHVHRAMIQVFTPGDNAYKTPLDARLHRRLGDIYLFAKQGAQAADQYRLALNLFPRDIFLQHKCALALLHVGDVHGASELLDAILAADPQAARSSTEIAGLKGRLYWQKFQMSRQRTDLATARDAYAEGLVSNPDSHYMADNVGQLSLLLGETDRAREAFEHALAALDRTGDRGYWALSTRATCLLALGRDEEGLAALGQVGALDPEPGAVESMARGLDRLHEGLGRPQEELSWWLEVLNGTATAAQPPAGR